MRAAKLWLATAAALLIAGLAVADALAGEPGLKLPPAAAQPAPAPAPAPPPGVRIQPEPSWNEERGMAAEPKFYLIPSSAMQRVSEIIQNMLYEIQRLEAIVKILKKGSCS